jgi:hypothetical protein
VGDCYQKPGPTLRLEDSTSIPIDGGHDEVDETGAEGEIIDPPKEDEFLWKWKVCRFAMPLEVNLIPGVFSLS